MEPYDNQAIYIRRTAQAILNGRNALLESPTGTGKTLCLLTAALGCLRKIRS